MSDTNGINGHPGSDNESHVDVLIVGPGPAGLMAAMWLSRFDLKVRIIDKRGTKVYNGQADGLQVRTLEIMDSFGVVEEILKHAVNFSDFRTWVSSEKAEDGIVLQETAHNPFSGMSRFDLQALNQGFIERVFLDSIKKYGNLEVERGILPTKLSFDKSKAKDFDSYPITVELRHLSDDESQPFQASAHVVNEDGSKSSDGLFRSNISGDDTDDLITKATNSESYSETVHAKFMIGCEGAHSWTRRQLGFEMQGDSTDYVWGVLDVIPITDFPDIRRGTTIQSEYGSMLIIPREYGVVRLYTQLLKVKPEEDGTADRNKITPDIILESCRKIMHPYTMSYTYCDWWTAYQIGQRVCNRFSESDRIFLAGDAVHTHSPKAGQGMNVSMGDTYCLGWKIAGVLSGHFDPAILSTYEPERREVANSLIELDRKLASTFSGNPTKEELMNLYQTNALFMSGVGYHYEDSMLVAHRTPDMEKLSSKLVPGKHLPSSPNSVVIAQSDKRPFDLQKVMTADGRFRVIVFPGDVSQQDKMKRLNNLGPPLQKVLNRYMYAPTANALVGMGSGHLNTKPRSVIELITLHKADLFDLELVQDFEPPFLRFDEDFGYDYYCIYADYKTDYVGGGQAYEFFGIDPEVGCMVAVRPDGMVGWVGALEDIDGLTKYFEGFMIDSPLESLKTKDKGAGKVNGR